MCELPKAARPGHGDGLKGGRSIADGSNIGQYTTIAEGLPSGVHRVNCVNLNETDTVGGGHDFRMISLVSS